MTSPNAPVRALRWKSLLLAAALTFSAGMALALPSPKDIENAVNAGQFAQAESMLNEVIREKPTSAKAHYELGQVLNREGRVFEARGELQKAQTLDPKLSFVSDPQHFKDMLAKLDAATQPTKAQVAPVAPQYQAPQPPAAPARSGGGFPWLMVLGLLALGVVGFMLLRRPAVQAPMGVGGTPMGGTAGGYGPGPMYPSQPTGGSGVGGAVLGGVAGLAAGYGLAKMMEHGDEGHGNRSDNNYTQMDYSPAPSSAPDLGNFDAGSGTGWDSGGGGGGDSGGGGGGDW